MRFEKLGWVVAVGGVVMGSALAGCGQTHGTDTDAGPIGGDGGPIVDDVGPVLDAAVVTCGATTCAPGLECCNASCGICVAPGGGCPALDCSDAGPPAHVCGGLGGVPCAPTEFCDYPDGSFCGADDSQGVCVPRPEPCPEPGGAVVCGCDGNDYLGACAANFVGVDVAHVGSCTTTAATVSATRSCGPTDGPAWTMEIGNALTCGGLHASSYVSITVYTALEGLASGTVLNVGSSPTSQGTAYECPAGDAGPPCFVLSGTFTLEGWADGTRGLFSYDLVRPDGSTITTSAPRAVDLWCGGAPICG